MAISDPIRSSPGLSLLLCSWVPCGAVATIYVAGQPIPHNPGLQVSHCANPITFRWTRRIE
jgi:hypothetical protein